MLGSAALEIIIGLGFVYLLFSLLCSTINEWYARLRNWRGKTLKAGINKLLADAEETGLALAMHQHPLIEGLKQNRQYPSYIAPATFALALMDVAVDFQAPATGAIPAPAVKNKIKIKQKNGALTDRDLTNEQTALVHSLL